MKKLLILSLFISMTAIAGLGTSAVKAEINLQSPAVYETRLNLRDLWVEHVYWVRNYVDATQNGNDKLSKVSESEIVANAKTIAYTIEPFYGREAADGLFNLLAGHWGAIKSYNTAVLADDSKEKDMSVKKLTDNARDISGFLSNANPHLPEDTVFSLLSAHGGHHISQINQISANDYTAEAKTWVAMRKHMLVIADAIAEALAKQFPDRFSG